MPQIPENIASSFMPPKRASQVTRSGITLLPTAHRIESLEEGEVISRTLPNTYISSSSDEAEKTAAMVQVTQAAPLLAPRVPPEVDIETLMNNEPARPEITELSRVEKIQKGLAFLQTRSQAMVSELQRLGVATPNPDRDRVAILEEEVKKLRVALEDEQKLVEDERKLIEDERRLVKDERRRREEAENALADVRRELREPFVVPALLDAFLTVSKLTTRVTSNTQER
ncbi:hypothetical protein BDQ12DRAFT_687093 [Crucibulum laeve]|uniref:Uncharacterized protein n=1 Tax=Crucibulum laeve TaxID=68775 RepID=A0A5C3LTY5_9AGAR|nr:hypothetical protein BDQ12DRAFT_687093 [Crucibulum laeve]